MNSVSLIVIGLFKLSLWNWINYDSTRSTPREVVCFVLVVKFMCIELFIAFPYCLFMSAASVVISLVPFLVLLICVIFSFFFFSLGSNLSVLLIFSKDQFFLSLIKFSDFCYLLIYFLLLWVYFTSFLNS